MLLQSFVRPDPVVREPALRPVTPVEGRFTQAPAAAVETPAANEVCAKFTDHDWRWHPEASREHPGRTRYVFRCKRCNLVGAHVDGA